MFPETETATPVQFYLLEETEPLLTLAEPLPAEPAALPTPAELAALEAELASILPEVHLNSQLEPLNVFYSQAKHLPPLTLNEEQTLGQRRDRGRAARIELSTSRSSQSDQLQAWSALSRDGIAAEQTLVAHNLLLVFSIAKRYLGRGLTFAELVAEGNLGLIRAAKKYEWQRGLKFSTCATWWIRQAVDRAVHEQPREISLPIAVSRKVVNAAFLRTRLEQQLGREPIKAELAAGIGVTPEELAELMNFDHQIAASLEAPVKTDEDITFGDRLKSPAPLPEEQAGLADLREQLAQLLSFLPPLEQKFVRLYYSPDRLTLEEIGFKFGLTEARIKNMKNRILIKLKAPALTRGLAEYL